MDPTNTTPNSNPVQPVVPGQPMQPVQSAQPVAQVIPEPVQPVVPVQAAQSSANNPMPTVNNTPNPINPVDGSDVQSPMAAVPVNPVFHPTNIDGINSASIANYAATAPETEISEEANMESLTMLPESETPSVSFSDPAMQIEKEVNTTVEQPSVKNKANKGVLVALAVILLLLAIALTVILVMQLTGSI